MQRRRKKRNMPALAAGLVAVVFGGLLGWSEWSRRSEVDTARSCVHLLLKLVDAAEAAPTGDSL